MYIIITDVYNFCLRELHCMNILNFTSVLMTIVGCLQIVDFANTATISFVVGIFWCTHIHISFEKSPKNGITGLLISAPPMHAAGKFSKWLYYCLLLPALQYEISSCSTFLLMLAIFYTFQFYQFRYGYNGIMLWF